MHHEAAVHVVELQVSAAYMAGARAYDELVSKRIGADRQIGLFGSFFVQRGGEYLDPLAGAVSGVIVAHREAYVVVARLESVYGVLFITGVAVAEVPVPGIGGVIGEIGKTYGKKPVRRIGLKAPSRYGMIINAEGIARAAVKRAQAEVGDVGRGAVVPGL